MDRPAAAASLDPGEVVESILADVRTRRDSGFYDAELTKLIATPFQPYGTDLVLGDLARLETVRPLESGRRFLRPFAVFTKRVIRRLMAWYVRPITIDQTVFNFRVVRNLADFEQRLARLEPLWERSDSVPAVEAGAPSDLAGWRSARIRDALRVAPRGPVIVAGPASLAVAAELADLNVTVRPITGNVVAELTRDASAPASVVLLAGVLPMLGARDVIECVRVTARRLAAGGIMLVDAPLGNGSASLDAAAVDAGFVRWVAPDTVRLLCEAAGLRVGRVTRRDDAWYVLEATKAGAPSA